MVYSSEDIQKQALICLIASTILSGMIKVVAEISPEVVWSNMSVIVAVASQKKTNSDSPDEIIYVGKGQNLFHEKNEDVTIRVEDDTGTWSVVARKNKDRYKAGRLQTTDKELSIHGTNAFTKGKNMDIRVSSDKLYSNHHNLNTIRC
jgi:DNA polymerase II small subunit/DNA polymerase delta subunit B